MTIMRHLNLNTGCKMPAMGFGTFMLKGDVLREALDFALFQGYRHIDTATNYGNEEEIGSAIDDRVRAGKLNRKDLFITTKVPSSCMRKVDTLQSAEKSLHSLRTTYLDMLLIHHPWACVRNGTDIVKFEHVDPTETWDALVSLYKSGKSLSIGVSNFTVPQLERVIKSSDVVPANVQLECHVYLAQKKLKEFCDSKNIIVSAYSPLGAPNRPSHHKQNTESLLEDPVVLEIAKNYKKTPAQILLNVLLRRGFAVISKSSTKERIKENLEALNITMTKHDFDRLCDLDRGVRFFRFLYMRRHPEFFEDEDF